jgi:TolB-like protein/tetratricopeptide (TPR) repeat protein
MADKIGDIASSEGDPSMAEERVQRRLAAILAADVVGYSRLMEQDETGTLAALKLRRKEVLEPLVARNQGRVFKVTGDGVLVQFDSAVNAVQCAIDLQRGMATATGDQSDGRSIVLRIGINLGDVLVEGSDLYGDGVNIAARLESIAEPGGILVSGTVYDHARNKIKAGFEDLGTQALKNIAEPVRVYRVAGTPRSTKTESRVTSDKPSIAVLPFTNMSEGADQQYFSDGITEDIITELSRFRQLHVLARNSSFQYRGKDVDVVRAGRELGVQYLVEGSVRKFGGRIRITAQLVETASGHHLWAERFDRDQDDIFAVQDHVTRTIVGTLVVRLEAAGAERVTRRPPASLAAYECVLRANALPYDDVKAEAEGRILFKRAIELDPGYARAHALLAVNLLYEWFRDMSASESVLDQAFDYARKSVELDEQDSLCHGVLGLMHLNRQSHELAEHYLRKSLELNPNRPALMTSLGSFYAYMGKTEEAKRCFAEARRLDPHYDPSWYWSEFGTICFIAHRYDEAIEALSRSRNKPYWVHLYLAASYAHTDKIDLAKDHAASALRLIPDFSLTRFAAKEPFKHSADRDHLLDALRKAGLPE